MVLVALTDREKELHEKAVVKIRTRLFLQHAPAAYCIVDGSERIIAASAESRWNAGCGEYRLLRLGGLTYAFDCGENNPPGSLSVCHTKQACFSFWVTGAKDQTVHSSTIRFDALDTRVFEVVQSFRRSIIAPVFTMKRRP